MATNQNSKNNVLWSTTWRNDMPKMARFHRETKKKNRFEGALQTNKQTDIQAGRRLDSAPVSDVVALATKVGPAGRLRW